MLISWRVIISSPHFLHLVMDSIRKIPPWLFNVIPPPASLHRPCRLRTRRQPYENKKLFNTPQVCTGNAACEPVGTLTRIKSYSTPRQPEQPAGYLNLSAGATSFQ